MFYAFVAVIAGVILLFKLIAYLCRDKPAALPANARQLPKRTDTALVVRDISPKPKRRPRWHRMMDAGTDTPQTCLPAATPKRTRKKPGAKASR
jgi:hypothetical protein